jgi:hypothetical protein
MVDKGFRRIAIGMSAIVALTSISVGVYLYFNFKSRSSLPVIVPANVSKFAQFQTRKIRDNYKGKSPAFLDSITTWFAQSPYFDFCTEAAQPGIALYSDLLYFENSDAQFLALSLTSESRFSAFLDSLAKRGFTHNQIRKEKYNYIQIRDTSIYIGYKFKAMVFMKIKSTNIPVEKVEALLAEVFSGKTDGLIANKDLQNLYSNNAHFIFYNAQNAPNQKFIGANFLQSDPFALENVTTSPESKKQMLQEVASISGKTDVNVNMTAPETLNFIFENAFGFLKTISLK